MTTTNAVKLSLMDGQRRQAPPEIGERQTRGGTLYVMVEVSAPTDSWDQASREIVNKALQTFAASKAEQPPQALQAAAEAVNQMLLTQNADLPESRRVWAGFNAIFIDGEALHLAQSGPALTYLVRGESLTRFPKSFDELKRKGDPLTPLGEQEKIRTRLARFALQPDDMVVMAASHITTFDQESHIHDVIQRPTPNEVVEGLIVLTGQQDFTACVVQFAPSTRPAISVAPTKPMSEPPVRTVTAKPARDTAKAPAKVEPQREEPPTPPPTPKEAPVPPPSIVPPPMPEPIETVADEEIFEEWDEIDDELDDELDELFEDEFWDEEGEAAPSSPIAAAVNRPTAETPEEIPASRSSPSPPRALRERFVGDSGRVAGPRDRQRMEAEAQRRADEEEDAALAAPNEAEAANDIAWGDVLRRLGAALIGVLAMLVAGVGAVVAWWRRAVAPQAQRMAPGLDRATHGMNYVTQRSAHAVTDVMRSALPGDRPAPKRDYRRRPDAYDGSLFLRTLAVLLPLLLLLLLLTLAWQRRDAISDAPPPAQANGVTDSSALAGKDFQTLVDEAIALIGQANDATDLNSQRSLLEQANERLTAALPFAPDEVAQNEVMTMQRQIADALQPADPNLQRLPATTLAALPEGSNPRELLVAGSQLFFLNEGALYRLPIDGTTAPDALFNEGEALSELGTMGSMQFLTYMPASATRTIDAVLLQTADGKLYELTGETIRQATFWPVATEGYRGTANYEGNYYLLDPTSAQVWKYVPDSGGNYTTNPVGWLQPEGQARLVDPIDIAIDGYIYVLERSGQVNRFQLGAPQTDFTLNGGSLSAPVALAKLPPEESDLFVAEANRIVRYGADGNFKMAYEAPVDSRWGAIRDIALDGSDTLFLLTESGVQRLTLP